MRKFIVLSALAVVLVVAGLELFPTLDQTATQRDSNGNATPHVIVGSANFPENELLGEIYAGALAAAGVEVSTALNLGPREVLFPALEGGDVTVVPEYTGALLDYLSQGESVRADTTRDQVKQLERLLPPGLQLLPPSAAQDQETVTCTREVVDRYSLRSLEDLGPVSGELVMGGPPELAQRAGRYSLPGLKEVYGIEFAEFRPLDVAGPLTVAALVEGKIDCANLFSTQSAITTHEFVVLSDPKGLIESQAVTPLISTEAARPAVVDTLNDVSAQLTTAELRKMVEQVEVDKVDAYTVGQEFLARHSLD